MTSTPSRNSDLFLDTRCKCAASFASGHRINHSKTSPIRRPKKRGTPRCESRNASNGLPNGKRPPRHTWCRYTALPWDALRSFEQL